MREALQRRERRLFFVVHPTCDSHAFIFVLGHVSVWVMHGTRDAHPPLCKWKTGHGPNVSPQKVGVPPQSTGSQAGRWEVRLPRGGPRGWDQTCLEESPPVFLEPGAQEKKLLSFLTFLFLIFVSTEESPVTMEGGRTRFCALRGFRPLGLLQGTAMALKPLMGSYFSRVCG